MRKNLSPIILIFAILFLLSSCAPKIYGQHKRKKRKCDCSYIPVERSYEDKAGLFILSDEADATNLNFDYKPL